MTEEVSQLPILRQIETVIRCKHCNTEVIPALNLRDNDFQLSCDKCKVTEYYQKFEIDKSRKHFKKELYLAGVLMRSYD
jgi:Zn finger protein HypA/HybF involved in hydrogenase expression